MESINNKLEISPQRVKILQKDTKSSTGGALWGTNVHDEHDLADGVAVPGQVRSRFDI